MHVIALRWFRKNSLVGFAKIVSYLPFVGFALNNISSKEKQVKIFLKNGAVEIGAVINEEAN